MKHVLESQQFDTQFLQELFTTADTLRAEAGRPLEGHIMASLFYEPSTRTRLSFETAMLRLGGAVVGTENAKEFSSAIKGETIEDSVQIVSGYVDCIVIRHPEAGASARAAKVSRVPVINAGDGAGQHPTQALLDLYTIWRERQEVDGTHVAMVGDLKHGRTVHSLAYLLGKYSDMRITLVSPPGLALGDDIKAYLDKHEVTYQETELLEECIQEADVVYQTRIQKERFLDPAEYQRYKGVYQVTRTMADTMKEGAIIMHPLPRVDEILREVDTSPHARYFDQAENGLYIRMALLQRLLT